MANPAPTINQINAFNATQGTTIDFNIIGGTELVRSNRIYIYDLSDNSLICTHLYASTESIHELPPNTDGSIVYESGKSSADFVNGAQYYAQIQTFTDIGGTEGGSGLSVAKMFLCLDDPTLTIDTIPSTISTTSYNVSATYDANTSVVSNIIQQYQFNLYSATGSLLQSSGVVVGNGEQQGTSTAYDISYNFTGLSVGSSYYVVVDVTTTQGMSINTQSNTFTVSIDTPTLGEATVVNNACDGYISVTSNLSSEYGGSGSGDIVSFETDSENVFTKLQVALEATQSGSGTPSPNNKRPIYGHSGVDVNRCGKNIADVKFRNQSPSIISGAVVTYDSWNTDYIQVDNTKQYSFQAYHSTVIDYILYYDSNKEYLGYSSIVAGEHYVISNSPHFANTKYVKIRSDNNVNTDPQIQLELGTTATPYEPYTETTISEQFNVSLTPTSKDTDPYLFKAVGDIYGDRLEEELVGGSVVWNQLVLNGNFSNANYWNKFLGNIAVANNVLTYTASSIGSAYYENQVGQGLYKEIPANHIIFTHAETNAPYSNGFYMSVRHDSVGMSGGTGISNKTLTPNTWNSFDGIGKPSNSVTDIAFYWSMNSNYAVGDSVKLRNVYIIDLTAMFGSTIADYVYTLEQATAGSGIAWLKSYGFFTKPYYEYDAGTLKSVNPTAHVTRGVNAWDEEWELGTIDATGTPTASSATIRSKNYIQIIPNTTYYCKGEKTYFLHFYDADKNWISTTSKYNETFTTPVNAYYMKFRLSSGTSYNNDMCINISNPTINGKYFPYEEHTYPLGDVTLRGKFELVNGELKANGDTYKYDGTHNENFKVVTLNGTENWVKSGTYSGNYYLLTTTGSTNGNQVAVSNYTDIFITTQESLNSYDKCIFLESYAYNIKNSSISTLDAFKTWLGNNPLTIIFKKATPTTETLTPFTQIQEVSKYGTLEYITNNGIPVGHNTTYLTRDVFGGTLDLVSGRLVVDRKYVLGDTLDWAYVSSGTYFYAVVSDKAKGYNNVTCNIYATAQQAGVANLQNNQIVGGMNDTAVYVKDSRYTNATTFKQAMNETGILYELATPLTYQLTPKQIQTLVGTNNVWSEQGDIELSYHIPITNLLVKRQDVDDVSGNWLTLYSQPITQASDMDFTFIDFLNQYGKTYKYALVPLLTQTQSGVEVEVEGGYTVSDEVQSIFDGVFISDSTGSQKCKANVGYGNVNMNQSVGSITPIGSQYPIIVTNSNNRYHNGSISGMIVPDDYYYNGNLSRIDMVNKRNELEQFLTNKRAKIIKDWNSNIWLVMIMDNIDCSFDNNYGMGMVTFNANWLEIGDPTNQEDLQATGLVDVGGV